LAFSPCAVSNSSAFATLVARAYEKAEAFIIGMTSPANYRHFRGIRRLGPAKVKFVVGRII
jgi:hypothetical protein